MVLKFTAVGEFIEVEAPRKLVHTREFTPHMTPTGPRETTIAYYIDPLESGTRVTVRDEGFAGRPQACYDNAEHWALVLTALSAHVASASKPATT